MPMGDPQKDAQEEKVVRNRDALERMLDSTTDILNLIDLMDDLRWTLKCARTVLVDAVLLDMRDGNLGPKAAKSILTNLL